MFVLKPKPTFEAEIAIPVPGEEPGKITFVFNHKGRKELKAFFDAISEDRSDVDFLSEIVVGWKDVDQEFNKENFEALLNDFLGAGAAILGGYSKALSEAREKN